MLWSRSASLIMRTRRSRAIATSILRKFSACRSSREEKASLPILLTPSTRLAISWPNSRSSSSLVAPVSSRTSWRRPAVTVVTSILKSTRRWATARGWLKYGSPEARCWPWCVASEEQQDGRRKEHGQGRQDRPGERLVHGDVHLLGEGHALLGSELPPILAKTVIGNDRVVHRVADDGQQRGQHGQGELAIRDGNRAQAHEHVVEDRDDGRHPAPEIEPHGDVEHDPDQASQNRVDGLELQVATDLGADEFHTPDLELAERLVGGQRRLQTSAHFFGRGRGQTDANQVFVGIPEALDDRVTQADLAQRRPDLGHRRRALEPHLGKRPTREVDVVPQPAVRDDRRDADEGDGDRNDVGPLPLADEVVVRALKQLDHMLIACSVRRRTNTRSNKRRVKKYAVKRLAANPTNRETAKPFTEPVPKL